MGANGPQRRYLHIKQLLEHVTDSGAVISSQTVDFTPDFCT
ncbi:hypothetical protein [Paenibacillus sp. GCM10012306]